MSLCCVTCPTVIPFETEVDTEGPVFDASQYDFFGKDVVEEVELGGLDDEEEELLAGGIDEEFMFDREEDDVIGSLLDVDDLSGAFSK